MILMVDDIFENIESHIEELTLSGFDVFYQSNVDAALRCFAENHERINLLILDVRMPTGNSFGQEHTQNQDRMGILVYEKIRQQAPDLPIIILTIFSDEDLGNRFQGESNCWFYQKADILPYQLLEEVRRILSHSKN